MVVRYHIRLGKFLEKIGSHCFTWNHMIQSAITGVSNEYEFPAWIYE